MIGGIMADDRTVHARLDELEAAVEELKNGNASQDKRSDDNEDDD